VAPIGDTPKELPAELTARPSVLHAQQVVIGFTELTSLF